MTTPMKQAFNNEAAACSTSSTRTTTNTAITSSASSTSSASTLPDIGTPHTTVNASHTAEAPYTVGQLIPTKVYGEPHEAPPVDWRDQLRCGVAAMNSCDPTTADSSEDGARVTAQPWWRQGLEADGTDPTDGTALLFAAFHNNVEDVASFIKQGAQVNLIHAEVGYTALMVAAEEGHVAVATFLLKQHGIDPDKQNPDGETALNIAAWNGRADVVACLLGAGASWQRVDQSGFNAVEYAIGQDHVRVVETFLDHGIEPAGDNVASLLGNQNLVSAAMIDLVKARNPPNSIEGRLSQRWSFSITTLAIAYSDGNHKFILRYLVDKGMYWACAIKVVAMLLGPRASSMKGANLQQDLVYCMSLLTRLSVPGAERDVIDRYRNAGISAAGVRRLGTIARMQLTDLGEMAAKALAVIGDNMMNALVDSCTSGTSLDYQVDILALKERLIKQGFCMPVAQVIATSWQGAITQPRETTRPTMSGWLWMQLASYLRMRTVPYEPARFAHKLLRLLDSRDLLKQLAAIMGDINDEGLHAQFQIQCDQLRQYCKQVLASTMPGSVQASH
jgi:hypothetical protein